MHIEENLKSQYSLIFLDIDHVLTNTEIDNTSFLSLDPNKYHISKQNLKWLDFILENTNSKIVIASNWRKFVPPNDRWYHKGNWYKSPLSEFKTIYSQYIIDMLPPERHITKSEALDLWCEDNADVFSKKDNSYVILEDDLREGYQTHMFFSKHLVLTDYRYGLTKDDALKAIEILKKGINNE